ncbi:MAG: hypothetical protein QE271_08145 [Bacteriovoracaceae bacterium]|nr:hypothetical protein [Bacteriovoracaceae bacterium]
MALTKLVLVCFVMGSVNVYAKRKEIREVFTNDHEMKAINLTMGRSTVLSFNDKPVKVVAGNSNYFNIEYVGTDLTIQPLAKVETNLFIYTQSKNKYGFHLKVGALQNYDDMVYVRWKGSGPGIDAIKSAVDVGTPPVAFSPFTFKFGKVEIVAKNLIHLRGTKTYALDFDVKNKDSKSLKLKSLQVFVSQKEQRLLGQQVVFEKDSILMYDQSRGRLFFPSEKVSGIKFIVQFGKITRKKSILKKYL